MSSKLRVVIVDDEPLARASLARTLAGNTNLDIVGSFEDGHTAVAEIALLKPDIAFLDIEMPGLNGLEVADRVKTLPGLHMVFVTAYSEHALRAFRVHALDYILKPYEDKQVLDTVARIEGRKQGPHLDLTGLKALLAPAAPSYLNRILVKEGPRTFIVPTAEIMWLQGARNYVEIHTTHKMYLYRHPLEGLADKLDPTSFVRIHRSKIINLHEIVQLHRQGRHQLEAITRDGSRHAVSAQFREKLSQSLDT